MTRISSIAILVGVIVAALAWLAYRQRISLEAALWHMRHGETVVVERYQVPAPHNWYVEDMGPDMQIMVRMDTSDGPQPKVGAQRFPATINISLGLHEATADGLDRITRIKEMLVKKNGVEPILKEFNFDGETLSCIGGEKFSQSTKTPQFFVTDPGIWQCNSSGRLNLHITATDADLPQVWDIVSHIRRKS